MYLFQSLKIASWLTRSVLIFSLDDFRRGSLGANLKSLSKTKEFAEDMSWAELLEEKARRYPDRTFLLFEDKTFTCRQMDDNANRIANYFLRLGATRGKGAAIMMGNCPEYLDVFIGIQKIGMYSVPINTSLRGNSLSYILTHCDAEFLVLDEDSLGSYLKVADQIPNIKTVIVSGLNNRSKPIADGFQHLAAAYKSPATKPSGNYQKSDLCFILYTSGTTGLPKGVVYRYGRTTVKLLSIPANAFYRKSDVLYTCMPLFHGNALFLTVTAGLHSGAQVVLAKKFSASRFWSDIRKYGVTSFNTIGAMIPILMKQPPQETDIQNKVRFISSAACPVDEWEKFEKRFGVKIFEGYGAVDGGGKSIMNLGNAPVGSIGKPSPGVEYRLVDHEGKDVPEGIPGELIFASRGTRKSVEYYKNEKASNDKLRDGWIYTGDLVRRDHHGYLYFVGRSAEFMRIKGENVSAYEVEHTIQKHPAVLEAAVYAVPSELAEDEIMACISLVDGQRLKESDLVEYLKNDLPKFAVPRFIKIVTEFPKTETQRIIKKELVKAGVVAGTYDAQNKVYVSTLNT
jgi:crotonobetaine/carnitine-CoA ligase